MPERQDRARIAYGGRVVRYGGTATREWDMRVTVDAERCHGHQMCAIAAPEVFGSDDYGNAVVLIVDDIPAELEAKVRRAEGNCPERAITIEE